MFFLVRGYNCQKFQVSDAINTNVSTSTLIIMFSSGGCSSIMISSRSCVPLGVAVEVLEYYIIDLYKGHMDRSIINTNASISTLIIMFSSGSSSSSSN